MSSSIPMSEKAKGKQKALPQEVPDAPRNRAVTVRFTEGVPDLTLRIQERDTVREVKRQIREYRPTLHNRRLRLIHNGRLLTDGIMLYDWLANLEERQRRAAPSNGLSSELKELKEALTDSDGKGRRKSREGDEDMVWLHCSIGGEELAADPEVEEAVQTNQLTPLRGFDRLANAGFSQDEIETVRRQFHRDRGRRSDDPLDETGDEEEHARALEEQWIDDIDNPAAAADGFLDSVDGSEGSMYTTTLQGLLTGFFFPMLPFYFMRQPPPPTLFTERELEPDTQIPDMIPSVIFSRRMQVAIILGLVANVTYAFLRLFH